MSLTSYEKNYARTSDMGQLPSLIEVQIKSFNTFREHGLEALFREISPIKSYNENLLIYFPDGSEEAREFGLQFRFDPPKHNEDECIERDMTYASPLYGKVALVNREAGDEIAISEIFLGEFPLMTEKGTFIINGTERVVVSQLIRSPGAYFAHEKTDLLDRPLAAAKLIPDRGAWMEFSTRKNDLITVKFNRSRTVPVTILLRAMAAVDDGLGVPSAIETGTTEELLALFADVDTNDDHLFIASTIMHEPVWVEDGPPIAAQALLEFFRRMRPGDPATLDNAREFLRSQLFDFRRYDLERVGRYKINRRLNLGNIIPEEHRTFTSHDLVALVRRMIEINNSVAQPDDIDHLGNRRLKTVGELIQNKLRVGLRRMERVVRDRMSIRNTADTTITPISLINIRPVTAAISEFYGSSQLSQFMEQTNPLSELTHKRTLSALGPGGLRRERAGFDVRDVHHSHYGRICPIETPEGPNIGLIGRLANYAKVNEFGFIVTPYRRVCRALPPGDPALIGRILSDDVEGEDDKLLAEEGTVVTVKLAKKLAKAGVKEAPITPFVTDEQIYLSADEEDPYRIAQADTKLDELGQFVNESISVRFNQQFRVVRSDQIDYIDVAPRQVVGISASLVPFLEHNDANRALMGSNMQRQAVPLLQPDVATVSTGMETDTARYSGQVLVARHSGTVKSVHSAAIVIQDDDGVEHEYPLRKFDRSNQSTCINQIPNVHAGQRVSPGDAIADSSSTRAGKLALGQNVLCAFLSWDGGNYEDALLISESLLRDDKFTSIHINKHEIEARDTRLGPEEITYDIPNVGDEALKDLDEYGIVRVGADVGPSDILVGKITPKGEKELTPEEKLLRAIFGEHAREVRDSSLRLPHGEKGKVIDVRTFTREEYRDLPAGVEKMVRVSVAQRRKLTVGDKMAGRHGNKGVISKIVPIEDMPYLKDGRTVELILNPLGVPSRMNIGQVLETHLGWAADRLGFRAITPVFDGAKEEEIRAELARAWLMERAWAEIGERAWAWLGEFGDADDVDIDIVDDTDARLLYLSEWLAEQEDYDSDALRENETYARRAVLTEWLREKGVAPEEALLFTNDGVTLEARAASDARAIDAMLRLWITHNDPERQLPADASYEQLNAIADQVIFRTGEPLPLHGKHTLYDGRSGESFDRPVTVGMVHVLKLAHLVEDKVHARSVGPYSLVTQQPLGGKAQFGGQRFGEMEVWALEAYGAAYTLQEMLTVKSDDVIGRVKTYEAIVKGEPIEEPGVPTSFHVLVKELQSLGLAVKAYTEDGELLDLGRENESFRRRPSLNETLPLTMSQRRPSPFMETRRSDIP